MPTEKNLDIILESELEFKPYSPAFDTFKKEPVTFLLVNALRHLTQDQQRQLCNALQERLPSPASIEQEAERLYPYPERALADERHYINKQRSAHIFCARQYMGEIEKLRAENSKMRKALEEAQALARRGIFQHLPVEVVGAQMCIDIDKLITSVLKSNIAL